MGQGAGVYCCGACLGGGAGGRTEGGILREVRGEVGSGGEFGMYLGGEEGGLGGEECHFCWRWLVVLVLVEGVGTGFGFTRSRD